MMDWSTVCEAKVIVDARREEILARAQELVHQHDREVGYRPGEDSTRRRDTIADLILEVRRLETALDAIIDSWDDCPIGSTSPRSINTWLAELRAVVTSARVSISRR